MTKQVFIIFGKIGTGKTTACDFIKKNFNAEEVNFADSLKEAAELIIGIPKKISYGSQLDKSNTYYYGKSARHWLQWLGTEVGRNSINRDIWVDRCLDRIENMSKETIVIGDGRFPNEEYLNLKKKIKERKLDIEIISILLKRPAIDSNEVINSHESETALDAFKEIFFDHVIYNTNSIDEFEDSIIKTLKKEGAEYAQYRL